LPLDRQYIQPWKICICDKNDDEESENMYGYINDLKKHVKDVILPVKLNMEDMMKVIDKLNTENQSLKESMSELVQELRGLNRANNGIFKNKSSGNLKLNK